MDSIRVSEAPDPSSILGEATTTSNAFCVGGFFLQNGLVVQWIV